jgi:MFS family permease
MGLGVISFDPLLYLLIAFSIIIAISTLLFFLHVDHVFIWTFSLLSCMYIGGSAWESLIITIISGTGPLYLFLIWWVTYGIAAISFLVIDRVAQRRISKQIKWDRSIALGILILGLILLMGVMEDFGCFLIWGLEHFNPSEVTWHTWIGNTIPIFYLTAIPGGILTCIGLVLGRKFGKRNESLSEAK